MKDRAVVLNDPCGSLPPQVILCYSVLRIRAESMSQWLLQGTLQVEVQPSIF